MVFLTLGLSSLNWLSNFQRVSEQRLYCVLHPALCIYRRSYRITLHGNGLILQMRFGEVQKFYKVTQLASGGVGI